tara:strand:+ start:144 stop:647 length:504 start_codon:yes stop_codon:yes gene_type:complete
MIIACNSCDKKFIVPDNAVTAAGRLVQCSSCGNKWTQYPIKKTEKKEVKKIKKNINKPKTKKNDIPTYSQEYLQKKHGIKIIDPSSIANNSSKRKSGNLKTKNTNIGYGFYSYLITLIIILIFMLGALNLTKDIIIYSYPNLEIYINHLYETLNSFKVIISDIIFSY